MPDTPFSYLDPKKIPDDHWPFPTKRPFWDREEQGDEEKKKEEDAKTND